jgi:tRNA(fMet)-specific endonuclease VapC
MIAAHSLSVGAALITNNTRHYQRIVVPMTTINWTESAAKNTVVSPENGRVH